LTKLFFFSRKNPHTHLFWEGLNKARNYHFFVQCSKWQRSKLFDGWQGLNFLRVTRGRIMLLTSSYPARLKKDLSFVEKNCQVPTFFIISNFAILKNLKQVRNCCFNFVTTHFELCNFKVVALELIFPFVFPNVDCR
jgi:hypothetical protein